MDEHDDLMRLAARVARRPGFREAVRVFAEAGARFRLEGPPRINKLLGQDTRFRTVCFTLWLDRERDPGDPAGGATYSRVLALISGTIGGSQRVVETTLRLMIAMGLVTVEPGRDDRRMKFYRPTPAMGAMVRAWLAGVFAALDVVDPAGRRSAHLAEGDAVVHRFIRGVGRDFRDGEVLTGRVPEFSCFFDREGGWPLLAVALRAASADEALPSRGDIARRFGLSKTQIASLFKEAGERGHLALDDDGRARPTAHLVATHDRWAAICFAFFLRATALPGDTLVETPDLG